MNDINQVIMCGHLARDPEVTEAKGFKFYKLTLATNHEYKDKEGKPIKETCFVTVKLSPRDGENALKFLSKGKQVTIQGMLKLESWEGKDGKKQTRHVVVANQLNYSINSDAGNVHPLAQSVPTRTVQQVRPNHNSTSLYQNPKVNFDNEELPF